MTKRSSARHAARLTGWTESVARDLRYAGRTLVTQPSFTVMALLALVLGIGLNTSLFAVINSLVARPWNVPEPNRVVNVHTEDLWFNFPLQAARFLDENSQTLDGVLASRPYGARLDGAEGRSLNLEFVTGNYFDVLNVELTAGRGFALDEDVAGSAVAVAVISHSLWSDQFGADPNVVGETVRVDGVSFSIIGIANESFDGTDTTRTDLWIPFATYPVVRANDPGAREFLTSPDRCCVNVAARLAPAVSREQAEAELTTLYRRYSPRYALEQNRQPADIMLTGTALLDHPFRWQRIAPLLALIGAAFASVLLLACANVSNLLLARAAVRQREIAVRTAIGARRSRVIRLLLTESLLLALVASAGGLALAYVLPGVALRFVDLPANLQWVPDLHVLAYAVGIAGVSALAFGLVPALRGSGVSVSDTIKQSTHATPRARLRGALLATQVAISVALLMAAGLLVRGVDRARSIDLGFSVEGVTAVQVTLPPNTYDLAREAVFYDELIASLEATGEPIALSMLLPLGDRWESTGFPRQCGNNNRIVTQRVSRGFFDVLQIPLVAGTSFPRGGASRATMVVDESLARLCWADRSPIGDSVNLNGQAYEIVGVAQDARLSDIGSLMPTYYAPFVPDGSLVSGPAFLLVPSALAGTAIAAVERIEPNASTDAISLVDQADAALGTTASVARMAGALGLLALMLAAVGVYGVISYSVEQRRHEIGVRMALGARPAQVAGLVLRTNGRAIAIGLAAGIAIAAAGSVVLRSQLYGLSPLDPVASIGVFVILAATGVAATIIPATRAARIDAATALHHD